VAVFTSRTEPPASSRHPTAKFHAGIYQTPRTPQSNTPTLGALPGQFLDRARQRCLKSISVAQFGVTTIRTMPSW
jgi:hypothetical protein